MIRFGLRLTLNGGREAVARLVIIAAAVAIGVGLLLTALAGINAVNTQNARYDWLNSAAGAASSHGSASAGAGTPAADPLWFSLRGDYFEGKTLGRVEVAATGPDSPVPPGIPRLPGPGEFYASPALSALLRATPAGQLGDRFPGHQVGTIGPAALPGPNSLVIIIGETPDQLSRQPNAKQITRMMTTAPSACNGGCSVGINANGMDLILAVVAGALIFPLLMFIGTATRLAAARREQRFAAMRLVGATPGQVSTIATVESAVAAIAGTLLGFGLFFLFRDPLAAIPFTNAPFFPSDLSLTLADILPVAVGVPVAAAAVARIALRRVRISPLGVSRRVTPRPPRAYRLIPLLVGVGELGWFVGRRPPTTSGQVEAYLTGFLITMAGLVIAGPWLTMVGARVMARRTRRPATLIAGRRLSDNPQAGFRAISGLVLALFVTSVAVGVITTYTANRGGQGGTAASRDVMSVDFVPALGQPAPTDSALPSGLLADLRAVPGVRTALAVRLDPAGSTDTREPIAALASCADLANGPDLGHCPAGAQVAAVDPELRVYDPQTGSMAPPASWPAATADAANLSHLPVLSVIADTDGSTATLERVRTILEAAYPRLRQTPATEADWESDTTATLNQWKQLANVVILTSLPIAGCSLAVSVAGGLSDRKRPFSLLRLTGVPLRMLRRVIVLESAVPLLAGAVLATGTGFLAAHLFLRSQEHYSLQPPGIGYYAIVLAGLAASLGIIASTLPLLRRITGPETARNE